MFDLQKYSLITLFFYGFIALSAHGSLPSLESNFRINEIKSIQRKQSDESGTSFHARMQDGSKVIARDNSSNYYVPCVRVWCKSGHVAAERALNPSVFSKLEKLYQEQLSLQDPENN